jgi:hypothetical protein
MTTSKRIALPLAVALHLLAFYALERLWKHPRELQANRDRVMAMHLLLLPLQQKPKQEEEIAKLPSNRPAEPALAHVPSPGNLNPPLAPPASPISNSPAAAAASASEPTPAQSFDPAALVKANRFEDSKSDLQRAIEAHGGTMEVVKKSKYDEFQVAAEAASIPDCIGPDALKLDPPHIGPIGFGGLFALPFLAHAAVTGKCK